MDGVRGEASDDFFNVGFITAIEIRSHQGFHFAAPLSNTFLAAHIESSE